MSHYYEEQLIKGRLYRRTDPNGEFKPIPAEILSRRICELEWEQEKMKRKIAELEAKISEENQKLGFESTDDD
jgi:hypothetical protein